MRHKMWGRGLARGTLDVVVRWIRGSVVGRIYWMWQERAYWFLRPKQREMITTIYEGLPGSGKSLMMCRDAIQAMRRGVTVYSNVQLIDPLTGQTTIPCHSWLDVMEVARDTMTEAADHGHVTPRLICFDEIHLLADARDWKNTPIWLADFFALRRHFGVGIMGTTQDLGQVEKRLRTMVHRTVRIAPMMLFQWFRLPVFVTRDLDARYLESPELDDFLSRPSYVWAPWYAYKGFNTYATFDPSGNSGLADDEAVNQRVQEITSEVREVNARLGEEPSVYAWWIDFRPDDDESRFDVPLPPETGEPEAPVPAAHSAESSTVSGAGALSTNDTDS